MIHTTPGFADAFDKNYKYFTPARLETKLSSAQVFLCVTL